MELKEAVTILKTIDVSDLRELCDVTEEMYDEAICEVLQALDQLQKENESLNNKISEAKREGRGLKNWQWCVVVGAMEEELKDLKEENEKYRSGELLTANQVKSFEETNKKYYIHKDKIKEKIEERKKQLEETSKRRGKAKEQEEQAVLWCIEIRLDERIKTYEELLKGE